MAVITDTLDRVCANFRIRLKALQFRSGIARMVLLGLVLMPLAMSVDYCLHLGLGWRLLALLVWLGSLAAVFWWTLWRPMSRRWGNREVLAYLDRAAPGEDGMLLDLFELVTSKEEITELESRTGQELADAAVDVLAPLARQVKAGEMFQRRRCRRWTAAGAVPILLLGLAALAPGGAEHLSTGMTRFFNPFSNERWPHKTTITVAEPETGWRIPQLEPFALRATVTGEVPSEVTLAYRGEETDGWIREKVRVRGNEEEGTVDYTFQEVREAVAFYIEGGDYVTDEFRIEIVARPFLKTITAAYRYPRYAGIPNRTLASGQLIGLEGTTVELNFESSMPLSKAVFAMENEEKEELELSEDGIRFGKSLVLTRSGSYTVELYEPNGFREARPEVYEIRVTEDRKPEVEILAPGRNIKLTRNASLRVAFRYSDDFGIRKVDVMHALDGRAPVPLSERVVGFIKEEGRTPPPAGFTWHLGKMEGLPDDGTLDYYVRVQDVNPTGRGVTVSPKFQVKLVKPSRFHQDTVYEARRIMTEAKTAWRNQLEAWTAASEWRETGTGQVDDKIWARLAEAQDKAIHATEEVDSLLKQLGDTYQRNHMAREFMAGRLNAIGRLLMTLLEKHLDPIERGLQNTVTPRTAAEAQPDVLLNTRRSYLFRQESDEGLTRHQHQRLAVLTLDRILEHLCNWQDLQDALIRTTRVYEDQEELVGSTNEIGEKWDMIDPHDLPEEALDEVQTVGKKQGAVHEAEKQLEDQLAFLIWKAESQQRTSIREPLQKAFKALRAAQVSKYMKFAAEQIHNNQASVVLEKQRKAVRILRYVKLGLEVAGSRVDRELPITLDMEPNRTRWNREPRPDEREPETDKEKPGPDGPGLPDPPETETLPRGEDGISLAVSRVVKVLGDLMDRTGYLDRNRSIREMPRFVKMKLGRLGEWQADAMGLLEDAIDLATDAHPPIKQALSTGKVRCDQTAGLIRRGNTSKGNQQLIADARRFLDDLLQYIAHRRKIGTFAENNRKNGGVDSNQCKYLFREENLEHVTAIHDNLNQGHMLGRDALRTLERFNKHAAKEGARAEVERVNRSGAARTVESLDALRESIAKRTGSLEPIPFTDTELPVDPVETVRATGVGDLLQRDLKPIATGISAGDRDAEQMKSLGEFVKAWSGTFRDLEYLAEELVKPKPIDRTDEDGPKAPRVPTRERKPGDLSPHLEQNKWLPLEIRRLMVRNLKERDFPPAYRELLAAYYASFAEKEDTQ